MMTKAPANSLTSSPALPLSHPLHPHWPSSLFLKHGGHHSTPGPLHRLLPLPRSLFLKIPSFPHLLQVFAQMSSTGSRQSGGTVRGIPARATGKRGSASVSPAT